MRRLFAIIFIICTLTIGAPVLAADITDGLDMNFINNAFTNPNPTTNKQFEDVMQKLEHPKEGFFTKMFKFFDKDKAKYDEVLKTKYQNANNQPTRIKDVPDEKPTVLITANSKDSSGNLVPTGYYQVNFKKDETGKYFIELTQGADKNIAKMPARIIPEDEKAPSVIYSRAEALNSGYIKVIYSNLDLTLLGFLKIEYEQPQEFEPLY